MSSASKYRYLNQAGALNEAAAFDATRASEPAVASISAVPEAVNAADETSGAAALYSTAHRLARPGLPAAAPTLHAQHVDPFTGRMLPPAPPGIRGRRGGAGLDTTTSRGWTSMFYYTVEDGQRVLMKRRDGTMEVLAGPRRVWRGGCRFEPMAHYVAHPGEFLIVRFRDGRQQHHGGPANVWLDPREHLEIAREDALQIAAKEAVVVYSEAEGKISRRIVYGPEVFVPHPGEWLHTFSWHGSKGGHKGYQKVPNGLVFQKLWLMPDQMYHDVTDVRTADDAVLTIRLMMFFELVDIETMLSTTHDPIGDFVNAATSDVVDFMGRHGFDSFKRHTNQLNDLAAYPQLVSRAGQCGYRINKIVYRGYGAPDSLQRMHDEAIESRTRLQLDRATQTQAQELEDFKLERQLHRAERQRREEDGTTQHRIDQERRQREAQLALQAKEQEFRRAEERKDGEQRRQLLLAQQAEELRHFSGLRELGVDLTQLLTNGKPDQVIELRGARGEAHLHLGKGEREKR